MMNLKATQGLSDRAYATLKAKILDLELVPEERFSEGRLAAMLAMSRTPIRHALAQLQREGYVEPIARTGWRVVPVDFGSLDEMYELRIILEEAAIRKICSFDLRPDFSKLERTWSLPDETSKRMNWKTAAIWDEKLHMAFLSATGNSQMVEVHKGVMERIHLMRRLDFIQEHRLEPTYREHFSILESIREGDADTACARLRQHIEHSRAEAHRVTIKLLQMRSMAQATVGT